MYAMCDRPNDRLFKSIQWECRIHAEGLSLACLVDTSTIREGIAWRLAERHFLIISYFHFQCSH